MSVQSSDPPRRRTRKLSDDEKALWDNVARSAKPLRLRARRAAAKTAIEAVVEASAQPPPSPRIDIGKPPVSKSPTRPAAPKLPPLAAMPKRMKSRVARGAHDIDARIDLHGMRQDEAHVALAAFLKRAAGSGHNIVLVITGKGKTASPDRERGVLRAKVPQWLALPEFRSLVIGFEQAHIGHGGEGALYVRIRKSRKAKP